MEDQSLVYIRVGGRTCIGQIVEQFQRGKDWWVRIEPVVGFAIEKFERVQNLQYVW